jgi:hypothetical protein
LHLHQKDIICEIQIVAKQQPFLHLPHLCSQSGKAAKVWLKIIAKQQPIRSQPFLQSNNKLFSS